MDTIRQRLEHDLKTILSFGPRAVGSAAEHDVANFLEQSFSKNHLPASRQNFFVSTIPLTLISKVLPGVSMVVLVLVGLMFFSRPLVALILMALMLILFFTISKGIFRRTQWVGGLRSNRTSQNIIARAGPADRPDAPALILVAHYDSKSQTCPMIVRLACVLVPLAIYVILLLSAVLWIVYPIEVLKALIPILIASAFATHLVYLFSFTANRSPGAIDNASGLAVLLALARELPDRFKDKVHLTFLASGAEELGLVGASQFVQRYRCELDSDRTLILNFDSLGAGGTVLLVPSKRFRKNPRLDIARQLLDERGFRTRQLNWMIGAAMDHLPFDRAGFSAVSFTQTSLRAARCMHSKNDCLDYVQIDQLADFTRSMIRFIEGTCEDDTRLPAEKCP